LAIQEKYQRKGIGRLTVLYYIGRKIIEVSTLIRIKEI